MTDEEITTVEKLVNDEILSAVKVEKMEMPIEEAKKMGAMALFGEKYGDVVRVVKAGEYSTELCGGTHVDSTGEIGMFKIVSESSVAAGVRRIEGITGTEVLNYLNKNLAVIKSVASTLKVANTADLESKAMAVANELKAKDKEIEKLSGVIANIKTQSLLDNAVETDGVKILTAFIEDTNVDELRKMCDMVKSKGNEYIGVIAGVQKAKGTGNICVVCGKDAVSKGAHAGNIARETAKLAGGSGGGKPDSAMAGAKEVANLPSAVEKSVEIIKSMLK